MGASLGEVCRVTRRLCQQIKKYSEKMSRIFVRSETFQTTPVVTQLSIFSFGVRDCAGIACHTSSCKSSERIFKFICKAPTNKRKVRHGPTMP